MAKKRISRKCINCKYCSAPSIVEKNHKRKIVHRCEARVSYDNPKELLLIDGKTAMNCVIFSRK